MAVAPAIRDRNRMKYMVKPPDCQISHRLCSGISATGWATTVCAATVCAPTIPTSAPNTSQGNARTHCIMIRSFLSNKGKLHYQSGAGIVIDSNEESELQEVNNKLAALKKALVIAEQIKN